MTAIEERRLKTLLKDAVTEVLEDAAMLRAIQSGEKSKPVSRAKIFQRLARAA